MSGWKRLSPAEVLAPASHRWFKSELGGAVLAQEQRLIDRRLGNCFGYHLLQLSVDNRLTLFGNSRIQRCFKAGPAPVSGPDTVVHCDWQALPFESDSIDVAIVHHALEFADSPHAMLRELQRVLVPHGRLLLIGFNPVSLLAARLWLAGQLDGDRRWHQHWLMPTRLQDWLALLNFAWEPAAFAFHRPPLKLAARWAGPPAAPAWHERWPLGGIYVMSAVKEVAAGIPLKPRWGRATPRLVALPVAKPTSRSTSCERTPESIRQIL